MGKIAVEYAPILMGPENAARYIGVSQSTLRSLPIPRKRLGSRVLYHRFDLEAWAADMRYDAEETDTAGGEREECDRLFGVGS